MTIFQLECFYALAQSLNFTQTASQQFITQPALSRSITSLESELGIKLINRTTRNVLLTPAGQVFAERCKKVIDTYQKAIQDTLLATQTLIGSVRFGVPIDSFEPLAVQLVQNLAQRHSGIHVELKFNSPTSLIRALDDGLFDIVVASGMPRNPESQFLLIAQRRDCVVLPANHPLAERSEINFSELRKENFVTISRASSFAGYESILTHASKAGFTPNIVSQAETISSLLMQVACGVGITVLYKEHQLNTKQEVVFVPLEDARLFNRYLIWNKQDNLCLNTLLSVARELFPQMTLAP